jgi:tyrosinase
MSAKNSTLLNTLLGVTWGAPLTSVSLYGFLPINLLLDLIGNTIVGLKSIGTPFRENWFSSYSLRDSFVGYHSERQGILTLSLNGILPRVFIPGLRVNNAITVGQMMWMRKKDWERDDARRMLEVWDIDGAGPLQQFSAAGESAVALLAETAGKKRLHATSWSRGFGNSVVANRFADKKLPSDTFARGMLHLAEPLSDEFPTGDGVKLQVDEYVADVASLRATAAIEKSLAFLLPKGAVKAGEFLQLLAPKVLPVAPRVIGKVKDVATEPYEGFYHTIELDTVTLDVELPQAFEIGSLVVRRLIASAGAKPSGGWLGGPAEMTQPELVELPPIRRMDLMRVTASGGEVRFLSVDQIEIKLNLTPPLGAETPDQALVSLLRADAALTAVVKDFTEPAKLTLNPGHPAIAADDLLLIRLGNDKRHVVVTAVQGEVITVFPQLDFPNLQLHIGTPINVQRWVPTGETDRAAFKRFDGSTITVIPTRGTLFRKGSMVAFSAGGKRIFREVDKMTDVKVILSGPADGAAPYILEAAQYDKTLAKTGVDVVARHRRLRWISGDKPSTFGAHPQFLLGIRPKRGFGPAEVRETLFFTRGLAPADPAHHRTWSALTEGGNDFWLLTGDLPIEVDGADTSWRFSPRTARKFLAAVEVEIVEYRKDTASRVDGSPAGSRIRAYPPEVQVPEEPAVTHTHMNATLEHEAHHVHQTSRWGPIMAALPVPGVAKLIATFTVAASDDPPGWAQRLLSREDFSGIEWASIGGILQAMYELCLPGEQDVETWQTIFNPISGALLRLIPDLDPNAPTGETVAVALAQLIGHAFDLRSWTPFIGLYVLGQTNGPKSFIEQEASRASGSVYTTILSADDRFNAPYTSYFVFDHDLKEADGERSLGSVTRMMAWPYGLSRRMILSSDRANSIGSPVAISEVGATDIGDPMRVTAGAEVVIHSELYAAPLTSILTVEGPAALARVPAVFHVIPAGTSILPRLRSYVPTPPRVNLSTGFYFVPASPADYTLEMRKTFSSEPATNVVKLKVTEGKVTLGGKAVPWVRPPDVTAPLTTLPVLTMSAGRSQLLSIGGFTTGWTADLDTSAQFTLQNEAQGWRIVAPNTFTPNVKVRVRIYRILQPNDAAFDLTFKDVPTLQGVRSLLDVPLWIPFRDFLIELVRPKKAELVLNGSAAPSANYIGWSPRPATVRLSDAAGATAPVTVTLQNRSTNVGRVVFSTSAAGTPADTLQLSLPVNGSPVNFFVRGKFGSPSTNDKDTVIEVVDADGDVLSRTELMVRIRKDATKLTAAERDRFVRALAVFNNKGMGRFSDIRNMHRAEALDEAHFDHGFLSWHRAYVLDLERELQSIDPSVAIPYWRFDKRAPEIFTPDFLGEESSGAARFSPTNPLQNWTTDSVLGILRHPLFNVATESARVISEDDTLALGTNYSDFVVMEGDPHGSAHTSFDGYILDPATAPRDPIFFLLHANVDRLWAKWQLRNNRFDPAVAGTYSSLGRAGDVGARRIGHNLLDTMWPWNGVTTPPRPSTAPGKGIPPSPVTSAPPKAPTVGDMIDYQGRVTAGLWQGFDYDDIKF